jgi:hypothetical protein
MWMKTQIFLPSEGRSKGILKRSHAAVVVVIAAIFIFCIVASVQSQSRDRRRGRLASEPSIISIHQIDFNNYTFPLNGKSYRLIDGFYAENVQQGVQWGLEMADGPHYGDLTGDKKEEAAFVLRYGPVASPNTAEARVYTLRNGQPVLLATFQIANAISCQMVNYIKLEDGMITIERIYGDAARCDHNEITQYRWNETSFMPVGEVKRAPCRCL